MKSFRKVGIQATHNSLNQYGVLVYLFNTTTCPFIRPPASIDEFAWFRGWFQPFIADLRVFLGSVKISITQQPFCSIINRFISEVGKKPIETISVAPFSMFRCGCQHCPNIQAFLKWLGMEAVGGSKSQEHCRMATRIAARV
jgi:hypothetical protein